MERSRVRALASLVLLTVPAAAVGVACSTFGEELGDDTPDADTPDVTSNEVTAPDATRGPFCPDAGPHDHCWDFTDAQPPSYGLEFANQSGSQDVGLDRLDFTSAPASFASAAFASANQSAARVGQRLTLADGVYRLAFSVKQDCPPQTRTATLVELYCSAPAAAKGTAMRLETTTTLDRFEVDVERHNGTTWSGPASVPVTLPRGAWARVEIDSAFGVDGGLAVRVDGRDTGAVQAPVGCAPGGAVELLLGAQFTNATGTCKALFDDVTLDVPK